MPAVLHWSQKSCWKLYTNWGEILIAENPTNLNSIRYLFFQANLAFQTPFPYGWEQFGTEFYLYLFNENINFKSGVFEDGCVCVCGILVPFHGHITIYSHTSGHTYTAVATHGLD